MKTWKRILLVTMLLVLVQATVLPYFFPEYPMFVSTASAASKPKLSKTKVTMYIGQSLKLSVKGASKVKWKTSDKKIATVTSSGKVKAKKAGKVTITATVKEKKLKCKITVSSAYEVKGEKNIQLFVGEEKEIAINSPFAKQIKVNCNNKAASGKWAAKSKKNGVLTVTATAPGTETFTISNTKTNEKTKITVKVVEQDPYSAKIKYHMLYESGTYDETLDLNKDGQVSAKDYILAVKIENAYADPDVASYSQRIKNYMLADPENRVFEDELDINKDGSISSKDYLIASKVEKRIY